jgi:glucuronoarabinoxylan endo-1,4-beta-xylanase
MMRKALPAFLALLTISVAGCGGGGGSVANPIPIPTPQAPTVSSTTPSSGATGVDVSTAVTATFSAAMSASTISTSTFALSAAGGGAVVGTVAYDSATNKATLTPSAKLANGTQYTATISTGVTNSGGTALAGTYNWSFTTAAATPTTTVTVDFGKQNQVIRGFGGSEAWSGTMPSSQISTLYGTGSNDLGLTIMRLRIAPAAWNSGAKAADTTQWTAELNNGKAAQDMGALVFATPWTAPPSMKTNNNINEGSIATSSYADYADYLESYVSYATAQGVNLYAISMQNEPDWNPCGNGGPTAASCYESCLWTAAQMDNWVANNSSVLTTKLIMPESLNFNSAMSDPSLDDPNAVNRISIIGGHLYGGQWYNYTKATSLGKEVWMTEHTVDLATKNATTQTMADALSAAVEVHNSLTVGQHNAYVYWWLVNSASLNYYSGLLDSNGKMTYFGAAVAQFSRFVRPGAYRYNATANPMSGVYVSAYGGSGHQAIVAINNGATAAAATFTIQGQSVSSLTPYQTTSSAIMAQQSAVTVTGNQFTYTLPAQSITTFVQ